MLALRIICFCAVKLEIKNINSTRLLHGITSLCLATSAAVLLATAATAGREAAQPAQHNCMSWAHGIRSPRRH